MKVTSLNTLVNQTKMDNDNARVINNPHEQITCAPPGFKIIKPNKRRIADDDGTSTHPAQKKPTINTQIHTLPIHTNNRYEVLDTHDNEHELMDDEDSTYETTEQTEAATQPPSNSTKKVTPPPIVIHGKADNHKKFVEFFNNTAKKGFHIKYNKETTVINLKDISEWKTAKAQLKDWAFDFHSYTSKEDKTHGFVVAGLEHEPFIEDLQAELKNSYNIATTAIYKMKGTKRPKYLVVMPENYNLKQLQKNVRFLDHVKITWERHYNNKVITQCHRCQAWGHATSNCYAAAACLKCGEGHLTSDCLKPADTPAICTNCKGTHTANSQECPIYQNLLQKINKTKEAARDRANGKQRHIWIPAPPPPFNAWERRRETATTTIPTNETYPNHQPAAPRAAEQRSQDTAAPAAHMDQFQELTSELGKLNSLINLAGMLRAIQDLNKILSNCKNSIEKFTAFSQFTLRLDAYGI